MRTPLTLALTAALTSYSIADPAKDSKITHTPLNAGYLHQFSADIDDGGSVSNSQLHLGAGVPLILKDELTVALTASYELHAFDFEDGTAGSLAALTPWEDIHVYKIGSYIRWDFADEWTLIATPNIRSQAENGGSLSDSISVGATIGAQRKLSDTLSLGAGFGFKTQLEDSASIYPVILIDWQINDALQLTTSPPPGTGFGPTLSLRWDCCHTLRFNFGVSYDSTRFRLDKDNAAAPNGIGEDSGIPLFASVTWKPSDNTQATFMAGARFGSELRLEDEYGDRISVQDYDATPFVGLNIGYTF